VRKASKILLLVAAACAGTSEPERPDVAVTAADDVDGVRILFELQEGDVTAHDVKVEAESGEVRDVCRSHDLRRVSVLWTNVEGEITCRFPYGQTGTWSSSGGAKLDDEFLYVFHESERGRVSARVPRGAPVRPALLLHVEIPAKELPATLQWAGREARRLVRPSSFLAVPLPASGGVLATGDWSVALKTKSGETSFLIGVDPDGTPTATSGFVRAP